MLFKRFFVIFSRKVQMIFSAERKYNKCVSSAKVKDSQFLSSTHNCNGVKNSIALNSLEGNKNERNILTLFILVKVIH